MSIARSFSRIVCINLDRRPDRWCRVQDRFAQHGIGPVERFAAVDGSRVAVPEVWRGREGVYGCLRSHLDVVTAARTAGVGDLLVFEDDVDFAPDLISKFERAMAQLPDDWDILYLGGIHAEPPRPVGDALARVSSTRSTFAYAIRARAFAAFLEIDASLPVPVDDQLAGHQGRLACYCIFPHAAWVERDHSDIQGREDHHWYIRESIVLGKHCMDDMDDAVAVVIPIRAPGWIRAGTTQVQFLIDHLRPHLRGLSVVLDESPSPGEPSDLAARAFGRCDAQIRYVLVAGSPVFLSQRDIIAAVQMCRTYDVVIPFQESVTLDAEAVGRVLSGRWMTVDPARYPRSPSPGPDPGWGIFARRPPGTRAAVVWPSVFQAPSVALQLAEAGPREPDAGRPAPSATRKAPP